MKKKSINLKKLSLSKEALSPLSISQKKAALGGGTWYCSNDCTYDPQMGCESNPRPGMQCV